MDRSDVDGLLHALERHTEEENTRDLQVYRQVDEYLAKGCDLRLVLLVRLRVDHWRWDRQRTCLLQVLYRVKDVSKLRRLDGSSQDLIWLVPVPQLDLKDELLEGAALHLGLGVLGHKVLEEALRAEPEHDALGDAPRSPHPLLGRRLRAPI